MTRQLSGKRGLIIGVANEKSIAWGIAKAMAEAGAELAFTYQAENLGRRVLPLAESVGSDIVLQADVLDQASLDYLFATLKEKWGSFDFLIHAVAYSDKDELTGRFINTTRKNFLNSMDIPCYSFIDLAKRFPFSA